MTITFIRTLNISSLVAGFYSKEWRQSVPVQCNNKKTEILGGIWYKINIWSHKISNAFKKRHELFARRL